MPGSVAMTVVGTQVVTTYTVAGDVSDFNQGAQDAILAGLEAHFSCYPPDCYAVLRVTAASVSLVFEMLLTKPDPSARIAQALAAKSEPLGSLSATVGATVEVSPTVVVTGQVSVVVLLAGPSPPPPSPHEPPLSPLPP
eukprot:scaffold116819_cov57-Phaeocystis_antarctica.AAC.1